MRNRELFTRRLEQIDGKLKTLHLMVSRGENVKSFKDEIKKIEETVEELKGYIEREPMSPGEINPIK
jgi:hypothetical protein